MSKLEVNKKKKKDALFHTAFELFTKKGLPKPQFLISLIRQVLQKAPFICILKINMISGTSLSPIKQGSSFSMHMKH